MIDSNTVMLGAFTLIPLMVLAYRSLKFSYEKQTGEGTEKITMEFIPPHFHPPVQPPEIIPPQTEKLIHEPIEINDPPISLPPSSSSTPLIEPTSLKFWQRLPKFLRFRN
jgi:hypothetical protein